MIRENHTAVIARNEHWSDFAATEPYEAGWAAEAVIFVRALGFAGAAVPAADAAEPAAGTGPPPTARVQISADGMRWLDEGTTFPLPVSTQMDTCARVVRFGNWLRIATDLPAGITMKVLVTVHLK